MRDSVDTRDPFAVEDVVRSTYAALFPDGDGTFVPRAFGWLKQYFFGAYRNYGPIDVGYHDFEHTLQGTLCLARLLRGRCRAGAKPALTVRAFELGMLGILFHDSGYLKVHDDVEGTGAKYTSVHVRRSGMFAKEFLGEKGYADTDILAVQNMISCTGLDADVHAIRFQNELEHEIGCALASADLLGQMAAPDYVAKLPLLHAEFAEALRYAPESKARLYDFASAEVLIRNTPAFWDRFVRKKLDHDYCGAYRFLNDPYPDGPNAYVLRIEANIAPLRQQLPATPA
jgi:hypothetical protein